MNLELLNTVLMEKDKTFPLSPNSALFLEPIVLLWQRIVPSNRTMSAVALLYQCFQFMTLVELKTIYKNKCKTIFAIFI